MEEWVGILRFPFLTTFFTAITFLGHSTFLYFFMPILYWCWQKRSAAYLIVLTILAAYTNHLIKGIFAWERPPVDLWLVPVSGYSFPSGHAMMATVIWGYLAYSIRNRYFTILMITLILLIAFSRVYLGVHYPQDVIAGIAVGALFLHIFKWSLKWMQRTLSRINDVVKSVLLVALTIIFSFLSPSIKVAGGMGLLAGIGSGFFLEPHLADFDSKGNLLSTIIKPILGMLISLAIWQGFEWILPNNVSFKWFQFFAVGIWVAAGAPWLFVQLRLSQREV